MIQALFVSHGRRIHKEMFIDFSISPQHGEMSRKLLQVSDKHILLTYQHHQASSSGSGIDTATATMKAVSRQHHRWLLASCIAKFLTSRISVNLTVIQQPEFKGYIIYIFPNFVFQVFDPYKSTSSINLMWFQHEVNDQAGPRLSLWGHSSKNLAVFFRCFFLWACKMCNALINRYGWHQITPFLIGISRTFHSLGRAFDLKQTKRKNGLKWLKLKDVHHKTS